MEVYHAVFKSKLSPLIWHVSVRSIRCSSLDFIICFPPALFLGSQSAIVFEFSLTSIQNAICLSFI